jgi:hypothetical protein
MRPQRLAWAAACTALGALAIALVLIDASTVIRAPVVLTFLLLCPGLAFVRLLQISDVAAEWSLGVAMSLALTGGVTLIQAYTGNWNPTVGLFALAGITLAAIVTELLIGRRPEVAEQQ